MRFNVHVPEKSNRKPILKKKEISTYFPVRKDIDAEPEIPEPVDLRTKTPDLHWICWPEPKKSARRPHTSQGFHRPPSRDSASKRNDHICEPGQPVVYQPAFKSWTNASDENERKAVEAMFELRRSQSFYEPSYKPMTSISINDPPPRDTYSGYGGRGQQSVDPRSIYQQSFFPYGHSGGAGAREFAIMNQLSRSMDGKQPAPYNYSVSYNKYPLHMRKVVRRTAATSDDYVHDQSMFMTTQPPCVGHFIIHPDWVSERHALRRSNSMILNSSKDGLRY